MRHVRRDSGVMRHYLSIVNYYILICIDFVGDNLSAFPNLHAIKTSDNSARVTYLYAHNSKLKETDDTYDQIDIKDFRYNLYGGGNSLEFKEVIELNKVGFKELEGINLFFITAFEATPIVRQVFKGCARRNVALVVSLLRVVSVFGTGTFITRLFVSYHRLPPPI